MRDPGKNPTNIQKDLAQCTDGTTVSSTVVLCYTPVSHTTDPGKKNITESAAPPALHHADYALSFADSNHFHIPQSQTPPPPPGDVGKTTCSIIPPANTTLKSFQVSFSDHAVLLRLPWLCPGKLRVSSRLSPHVVQMTAVELTRTELRYVFGATGY